MVLKEIRGRALEGGREKYLFAPHLIPGQAGALPYLLHSVNKSHLLLDEVERDLQRPARRQSHAPALRPTLEEARARGPGVFLPSQITLTYTNPPARNIENVRIEIF